MQNSSTMLRFGPCEGLWDDAVVSFFCCFQTTPAPKFCLMGPNFPSLLVPWLRGHATANQGFPRGGQWCEKLDHLPSEVMRCFPCRRRQGLSRQLFLALVCQAWEFNYEPSAASKHSWRLVWSQQLVTVCMAHGAEGAQETLTRQLLSFGERATGLLWQNIACSKRVAGGKKGEGRKGGM